MHDNTVGAALPITTMNLEFEKLIFNNTVLWRVELYTLGKSDSRVSSGGRTISKKNSISSRFISLYLNNNMDLKKEF